MLSEVPLFAQFLIRKHAPFPAETYKMIFVLDSAIDSFNDSDCCYNTSVIATGPVKNNTVPLLEVAEHGSADVNFSNGVAIGFLLNKVDWGFCLQDGIGQQVCVIFRFDWNNEDP